jgi:subtilase family serine protease
LFAADVTAAGLPGVGQVSDSWGGEEMPNETSYDSIFVHSNVTFLFSTGDLGAFGSGEEGDYVANYPATSPNVVAVGGTSLTINSGNTYGGETAWGYGADSWEYGGGGGGISAYESQPSYQTGKVNGLSSTHRTEPDISMDADPDTGVPFYDSYDFGTTDPWSETAGTSLACPLAAGLIAIANQGRELGGETALTGNTQTLPDLYSLPSSDFHDITTGNNGYAAGPGYDLATGIGSPIANLLIPALAPTPTGSPTWLASGSVATYSSSSHILTVTGATTITTDPGTAEPIIEASGSSAVVTFNAPNPANGNYYHIGGLSLTNGASAVVTSLGASRTIQNVRMLVIGVSSATTAPTFNIGAGTLDLTDNDMAILYGTGTSPLSTVSADIKAAYDNKLWDKPGLTSSIAKTMPTVTALGYGEASTLGDTFFDSLYLGGNAVLVKYTLVGDANLDGTVNFNDFSILQNNYGLSSSWTGGDFNYDGVTNFNDFSLLQNNYDQTLSAVLT